MLTDLGLANRATIDPNAVEMLCERLRQAEQDRDRRRAQTLRLYIAKAEKAHAKAG